MTAQRGESDTASISNDGSIAGGRGGGQGGDLENGNFWKAAEANRPTLTTSK